MEWTEVFSLEEEELFSELQQGALFAIPNTRQVNKYWNTSKSNWLPYMSPIIAKKVDEETLQELMSAFPVPRSKVTHPEIKVIPVKFTGN